MRPGIRLWSGLAFVAALGCGIFYLLPPNHEWRLQSDMDRFFTDVTPVIDPLDPYENIPIQTAEQAGDDVNPDELVVGVTYKGQSRAYPLNSINVPERKVLNDVLNGEPILIVWCDLCHAAAAFSRRIDDHIETFGCSGMLWKETLVMYDLSTRSCWNHVRGEAVAGPRRGEALTPMPASVTTWSEWKDSHPETTVVDIQKPADAAPYDYPSVRRRGPVVFSVRTQCGGKAWSLEYLEAHPVLATTVNRIPAVVLFNPETLSAQAFESECDGTELTFHKVDGQLADRETGSRWNMISGLAVDGPRKGQFLKPIPGVLTLETTWKGVFPATRIIRDDEDGTAG